MRNQAGRARTFLTVHSLSIVSSTIRRRWYQWKHAIDQSLCTSSGKARIRPTGRVHGNLAFVKQWLQFRKDVESHPKGSLVIYHLLSRCRDVAVDMRRGQGNKVGQRVGQGRGKIPQDGSRVAFGKMMEFLSNSFIAFFASAIRRHQ